MLAELVDLFTPNGGSVLDPYPGSMSVEVYYMKVGRVCVCIEHPLDCYEEAVDRWTRFVLSQSKKKSVEEDFTSNADCKTHIQNGSQPEPLDTTDILQPSYPDIDSSQEIHEASEGACNMQKTDPACSPTYSPF